MADRQGSAGRAPSSHVAAALARGAQAKIAPRAVPTGAPAQAAGAIVQAHPAPARRLQPPPLPPRRAVVQPKAPQPKAPQPKAFLLAAAPPRTEPPRPRTAAALPPQRPAPAAVSRSRVIQPSLPSREEAEEIGAEIGTALRPLFGVEDAPTNPFEELVAGLPWWRRWRLGTRGVVDELFQRFGNYGFRYNVGMSTVSTLLGTDGFYQPTDLANGILEGNCISYSRAFASLLAHFNIAAEAREVREESQGAFITRPVQNFIDARVQGNIRYKKGGIIPGRYLFTNHAATYVPALGLYYDPMIRRSYTNFSVFIDPAWALRPRGYSGNSYWLKTPQFGGNALIRSTERTPGFTQTWQLVHRKGSQRQ